MDQEDDSLSDPQEEAPIVLPSQPTKPPTGFSSILPVQEREEEMDLRREPQLYLCDDWLRPVEVMQKPGELRPREKVRARVPKNNFLLVTLMSLNVGYGSLIEDYQREGVDADPPTLNSVTLTDEEAQTCSDELDQRVESTACAPVGMPPSTILARRLTEVSANNSSVAVVKDANLKMYHVMSVKQSLREDLAEHSYQFNFSCRAADWSKLSFSHVPMQFEPLELHVVDALGQQDVPDYFQQPAKAITEDVSVMRGPQAQEWIQAVREEIESRREEGGHLYTVACETHSRHKAQCPWWTSKEEG